jgi:putative Holliday junction resolvase
MAMPLVVIETADAVSSGAVLGRIIEDYEVELVVVGLPLTLEGEEGPQARHVRTLADRMARFLRVPVEYTDERLSSVEASRRMRELGATDRSMRGSVDKVAASVFLQAYLDGRARTSETER